MKNTSLNLFFVALVFIGMAHAISTAMMPTCGATNCTSPYQCCGGGTRDPTCYNPQQGQCCTWYDAAQTCSPDEACCGEMGYGASSVAFCCPSGSTCCQTTGDGSSTCCGPEQICCGGFNTLCCDKATEQCGNLGYGPECVPKAVPTAGPHPAPGQVLWRTGLDGGTGATSVVAFNNTHVAASGKNVYLINRMTGEKTNVGLPASTNDIGRPTAVAGQYLIACAGPNFAEFQIDVKTSTVSWSNPNLCDVAHVRNGLAYIGGTVVRVRDGKQLWADQKAARNTPIGFSEDGSIVYVPQGFQEPVGVTAFKMSTGEKLFGLNNLESHAVVMDGLLIVELNLDAGFHAVNGTTGELVWQAQLNKTDSDTIIGATNGSLITTHGTGLRARDLRNGHLLWQVQYPNSKKMMQVFPPSEGQQQVFVAVEFDLMFGNTSIFSYDARSGKQLWQSEAQNINTGTPNPVLVNGVVYAAAIGKNAPLSLVAIDAQNGQTLDSWTFGDYMAKTFLVQHGALYVGDNNGYVTAIKLLK